MTTKFVCYRTWPVTADNVKSLDGMHKVGGADHEVSRTFWLVFRHCGCSEEYRRVPSIFGDLEFTDQARAPYRVPPVPVASWFGALPTQDWEWASRKVRCKNCKKELWGDFHYFEEYVDHWNRHIMVFEQFYVYAETIMKDEVSRLVSVEAGNAAHYELRSLTPIEMMQYLGYTDFKPNQEKS